MALYIISKKKKTQVNDRYFIKKLLSKNNFYRLNYIVIFIIILTFLFFAIWPPLFKNYSLIFNSSLDSLTSEIVSSQSGLPSGMRWLGYTLGEITRNVLIEFLILKSYKKQLISRKSKFFFISIFIVLLNGMFTTSRIMIGLFTTVVFLQQIYYLYPNKRKLLLRTGAALGTIMIILIALLYLGNTLSYQSNSQVIQGYTNGYYNVYQSMCVYQNASQTLFDKIEMFLIGDGFGNINLISMFVNGINSSDLYNNYIYGYTFNGGAVVPYISQLSYYFSIILAPLFSFSIILCANKYEIKWKKAEGNILINGLLSILLAATPFMYNWSTLIHILTIVVLPIWLIYKLNVSCK